MDIKVSTAAKVGTPLKALTAGWLYSARIPGTKQPLTLLT
jgi:hypothetical protein